MTLKHYKYIVTIEGIRESMEFKSYEEASETIEIFMPCKATIECKEI